MCKLCELVAVLALGGGLLSLSMILIETPTMVYIYLDRNQLLENQSGLFDAWAGQPLRQKHQFFLFNITGGDRFLRSDAPMTVEEVGPFVYDSLDDSERGGAAEPADGYNLTSLSLKDLRFNSAESVGDESLPLHTLNIPLIRRLSSKPRFLFPEKELLLKTTVRDILREIADGCGSGCNPEPFPDNDVSRELPGDATSRYLRYLRNELCLRLFRVIRFVNPPVTAKSGRFFRKLPCDCLGVAPNGTEKMCRDDPKYGEVLTSKYLVLWDDERCAETPGGDTYKSIGQDWYVTENLFSVSSAAYWRGDDCVQYDRQIENDGETRIKVEQFSDVITDFSFEYQLNLPIKFRKKKVPVERVHNYPILRTVTSGASVEDVDSSIYRYIVYPRKHTSNFEYNLKICAICFATSFLSALFLLSYRRVINSARNPE